MPRNKKIFRFIKYAAATAVAVPVIIFLGFYALGIGAMLENTGKNCEEMKDSEIKSRIVEFAGRRNDDFTAEGLSLGRDRTYSEHYSGDLLAVPFDTLSGSYTAMLTCDSGIDISRRSR